MSGPDGASLRLWPLLRVRDLEASIDFWTGRLGFALAGADGEPGARRWCRLERGGASVMLQQGSDAADPARSRPPMEGSAGEEAARRGAEGGAEPKRTELYFVCDDVDRVHAELTKRGLRLPEPFVAEYGMKQLRIPEPDGHGVWFESPYP